MVFPAGGREPFLCVRVVGCSSLARPPDSFYRSLERGVRNGTLFPFVMDVLSVSDAVRRSSPFIGGRAEAFFLTGKKLQSVYSILRCAGYLFPVVFQGVSIGPVPACEAGLGPLQKSWEGAGGGTGGGETILKKGFPTPSKPPPPFPKTFDVTQSLSAGGAGEKGLFH